MELEQHIIALVQNTLSSGKRQCAVHTIYVDHAILHDSNRVNDVAKAMTFPDGC